MLTRASDVVGKMIITRDNQQLGQVSDLVYDPNKNRIIAFLVLDENQLSGSQVLLFNDVLKIQDMVYVRSEDVLKSTTNSIKLIQDQNDQNDFLVNEEIVNEQGQVIGNLKDIVFDSQSGKVREFIVKNGQGEKNFKVAQVISSFNDRTVVKEQSQDQLEETKEQFKQVGEETKQKVQEKVDEFKEIFNK